MASKNNQKRHFYFEKAHILKHDKLWNQREQTWQATPCVHNQSERRFYLGLERLLAVGCGDGLAPVGKQQSMFRHSIVPKCFIFTDDSHEIEFHYIGNTVWFIMSQIISFVALKNKTR